MDRSSVPSGTNENSPGREPGVVEGLFAWSPGGATEAVNRPWRGWVRGVRNRTTGWRPWLLSDAPRGLPPLPRLQTRDAPAGRVYNRLVMRRCSLWAILAAATWTAAGDGAPAGPAWGKLFSATAPAGEGRIDAVLAACGNDPGRVKSMIASDAAYAPFRGGWHRASVKVAEGKTQYDVAFHVRIPRGYVPGRSFPLLLAAHGQKSTGREIAKMMAWLLGPAAERYILLAPTLPGADHFTGRAYQEQAYLKPLAWARRRLNVDDDRIYVSGYSMGGHNAWHLATMFPRHFAAAVPLAGVPRFEGAPYTSFCYLENLAHLPVWAIWGQRDRPGGKLRGNADDARAAAERLKRLGNRHFQGTELAGAAHAECLPPKGQLAPYLAARTRRAVPEKLTRLFHLPHHRRGYYLEALELACRPVDLSRRIRVRHRAGSVGTQADARAAVDDFLARNMFRMHAVLARRSNALSVRAAGVRSVRVYVMDGMFDLDRPVRLQFAGRSWSGKVGLSARCLLTHYAETRDATALVCNEVDLDASGKVTVRFR